MTILESAPRRLRVDFLVQRRFWVVMALPVILQIFFLFILWLAPHPLFRTLLAPPIRFRFGEQVLHYPWHLAFLVHAAAKVRLLAMAFGGAWAVGFACVLAHAYARGEAGSPRKIYGVYKPSFWHCTFAWSVAWAFAKALTWGASSLLPIGSVRVAAQVALLVVLQMLLVYAIALAAINRMSWWNALGKSARLAVLHPVGTLLIVAVPVVLVLGTALMLPEPRIIHWMMQNNPDMGIGFIAARIVVAYLADGMISLGAVYRLECMRETPALA